MSLESEVMKRVNGLLTPEWRIALDTQFEDFSFRLVLADWLIEQGREVEADGLRWSAKKGIVVVGDYISPKPGKWFYFCTPFVSCGLCSRISRSFYGPTIADQCTRSPSTVLCFLMLAWADSSESQRSEYWAWSPKEISNG